MPKFHNTFFWSLILLSGVIIHGCGTSNDDRMDRITGRLNADLRIIEEENDWNKSSIASMLEEQISVGDTVEAYVLDTLASLDNWSNRIRGESDSIRALLFQGKMPESLEVEAFQRTYTQFLNWAEKTTQLFIPKKSEKVRDNASKDIEHVFSGSPKEAMVDLVSMNLEVAEKSRSLLMAVRFNIRSRSWGFDLYKIWTVPSKTEVFAGEPFRAEILVGYLKMPYDLKVKSPWVRSRKSSMDPYRLEVPTSIQEIPNGQDSVVRSYTVEAQIILDGGELIPVNTTGSFVVRRKPGKEN